MRVVPEACAQNDGEHLPPRRLGGAKLRLDAGNHGSPSRHCVTRSGAGIASDTRSGTAYAYTYNKRNRLNTVKVATVLKSAGSWNYGSPTPQAACQALADSSGVPLIRTEEVKLPPWQYCRKYHICIVQYNPGGNPPYYGQLGAGVGLTCDPGEVECGGALRTGELV